MSMEMTPKGTKKFTKEEKLSIIKEAQTQGVMITLEKYDIYPGTYYYWKRKLSESGSTGLDHSTTKESKAKIRQLEKENSTLKKLLAEKELESELKSELLKKKYPHLKKYL